MNVYDKLKEMHIELPKPPAKGGLYTPCKQFAGRYVYVSGCGPHIDGHTYIGKLGTNVTLEEGQLAARDCMLNVLSVLESKIGDLNKVTDVVKLLVFISSDSEFFQQPQVANGASALLSSLFGPEIGLATRSAIATPVLPGNISVEIEALFEIEA